MAVETAWLVDASVALKWFMPRDREPDADLARATIGQLAMRTTSLAVYEIGNILTRKSGWDADRIALTHNITFYDASYVAIAERTRRRVLSADSDLIRPGLADSLETALG